MKDAVATMGTILPDDVNGRDAVHVAVVATVATQGLKPGQDVGKDGSTKDPIGIVDPFLKGPVFGGQKFWLYLYPRTITSLNHQWTHPAFPEVATATPRGDVAASELWLRQFIERSDCPGYETVIAAAVGDHHKNDGGDGGYTSSSFVPPDKYSPEGYLYFGGQDAHGDIPPEFWDHVEIVTGRKIPREKRAAHFTCSC